MHGDKLDKTDIELFTKVIVDKKTKFEDGRMDIDEIMRKITVKTKASSKKNSKSKKSK
jgi:alkyl hydroperoxide reductase subunit AhpF